MNLSAQTDPQHRSHEHSHLLAGWKPKTIRLINPDRGRVQWVRENSPDTIITLRDHQESERYADMMRDPESLGEEQARKWHRTIQDWALDLDPDRLLITGINEPPVWMPDATTRAAGQPLDPMALIGLDEPWTQDRDWDQWAHAWGVTYKDLQAAKERAVAQTRSTNNTIQALNRYTLAYLKALGRYGYRGLAYSFSVGWPANTGHATPVDWSPYDPVMKWIEDSGGHHLLAIHEYWCKEGPKITADGKVDWNGGPWGWTAGRYLQCPYNVGIVIGECGLEQAVCNPAVSYWERGWKAYYWGQPKIYADQCLAYDRETQKDGRILAAQLYLWDGTTRHWGSLFYDEQIPFFGTNADFRAFPILAGAPDPDPGPGPDPDPDPDPDPGVDPQLAAAATQAAAAGQVLELNPDAALQKSVIAHGDGWIVNGEKDFTYNGKTYRAQRAEDPYTGQAYTHFCEIGDWGNVIRVRS